MYTDLKRLCHAWPIGFLFVIVSLVEVGNSAISYGTTVSLSQPTGRVVVQRDGANQATVAVVGTLSGQADRIEARAVTMYGAPGPSTGWVVVGNNPSQGAFSGSLTLPGGWYQFQVRAMSGSNVVAHNTVDRVGVGEVFVAAGQSNSANFGSPVQIPGDRVSAYNFTTGSWQRAVDPQPTATGSGGSPWPDLGDILLSSIDVPIGFISVGVGGTSVGQWVPGGPHYSRIRDAVTFLGPDGFRAILWHQGESDSAEGTSTAVYAQRLESIIAQSRLDAGFDVPWGVALASWGPVGTPESQAAVIAAQTQVIANDPLVFQGASTDDFHNLGYLIDEVHFNDAGLFAHAQQWADAIETNFALVPTPEPTTLTLVVVGLLPLLRRRRGSA